MKKILFWGGSKLTEMLIKFLKPKKDFYIYDPMIDKLNFKMKCKFFNRKEDFIKIISECDEFIVGIGGSNGYARLETSLFLKSLELKPISYVSSDCHIYSDKEIGEGNIIFPLSAFGNNCQIGNYNFIDFRATSNHDTIIKDGNFLAINSVIQGESIIGNFSSIYTNSVLGEHLDMKNNTILGANSFLKSKEISSGKIYAGIPAREIGINKINFNEDKIDEIKRLL